MLATRGQGMPTIGVRPLSQGKGVENAPGLLHTPFGGSAVGLFRVIFRLVVKTLDNFRYRVIELLLKVIFL